jgi:hypothetical protein
MKREGFLSIDHRASPGMPGMPALYEAATACCAHCGAVVVLQPLRTRPRGHCRKCDAYVCDNCTGDCRPFAKVLDDMEKRALKDG